jgi:glycosyltransferase involved in cell wall biosynthesis
MLAIGRLASVKGFPVLFAACRRLSEQGLGWSLRIAGDGPERAALEGRARALGLIDHIDFLGPLAPAAVQAELRAAGMLVLPSFLEGIPVVLMEAMAAGVPVVASRVGGVAELVEDRVSGRLVAPGSSEDLAAAIRETWEHGEEASRRAIAARKAVERGFDVRGTAREMRALFERYHGTPCDARVG